MSDYRLSPQAFRDIDEIWEFIAEDNLDAADRIRDEIFAACERLAEIPGMGHFEKTWPTSPFASGGYIRT